MPVKTCGSCESCVIYWGLGSADQEDSGNWKIYERHSSMIYFAMGSVQFNEYSSLIDGHRDNDLIKKRIHEFVSCRRLTMTLSYLMSDDPTHRCTEQQNKCKANFLAVCCVECRSTLND